MEQYPYMMISDMTPADEAWNLCGGIFLAISSWVSAYQGALLWISGVFVGWYFSKNKLL